MTAMRSKGKSFLLAAGVLASMLGGAAPALAQHSGGGRWLEEHGGGGGHMSGRHAATCGHGWPRRAATGAAGAGGRCAPGAHYALVVLRAGRNAGLQRHGLRSWLSRGLWPRVIRLAVRGAAVRHGGYGYGHGYYGHGYSTGAYWRGGYWHGGFWPRAYYGVGFAWYLPVLPLAYATYWYGGIPYYYANDVYYTYNPSYEGYVATEPPPAADGGGAGGAPPTGDAARTERRAGRCGHGGSGFHVPEERPERRTAGHGQGRVPEMGCAGGRGTRAQERQSDLSAR